MGRLNYILTAEPNIDDRHAKVPEGTQPRGEIEFRHLTFTYPTTLSGNGSNGFSKSNGSGPHPVLRDINLRVPAGSTLAIIGPPAAAKTTLAALIARLWEAPDDCVLIDGRPIREWPLTTLRQSIGFVPQDTYLFGESVGGNIAFGLPEYDDQRVREAAEIASLHGDVQDFAKSYDTMVGERGITLSGGQKQRAAIARAVVRDPHILILDDALSAVDTQTEERILNGLRGIMQGRTTILISTAPPPSATPTRSLSWLMEPSPSAARTMNCWLAAAITRICIRSNCWKKSSNAHEQSARRRSPRQSVRFALDAPASAIHEAIQMARGPRASHGGHRHPARARPASHLSKGHRQLLHSCSEACNLGNVGMDGIGWLSLLFFAVLAFDFLAQYIQIRIMQRVGQQTMYDMRREIFGHLQRLPMSYSTAIPRPPGYACHHRCRCSQRPFRRWRRHHDQRLLLLVVMAGLLFKIDTRLALATSPFSPASSCSP